MILPGFGLTFLFTPEFIAVEGSVRGVRSATEPGFASGRNLGRREVRAVVADEMPFKIALDLALLLLGAVIGIVSPASAGKTCRRPFQSWRRHRPRPLAWPHSRDTTSLAWPGQTRSHIAWLALMSRPRQGGETRHPVSSLPLG